MSDSAEGSAPKAAPNAGASGEPASNLAPEEAERLAEAFIPSWQFDQATFTPGVMSQEEMERLAAPSSAPLPVAPIVNIGEKTFGDDMTASDVDISGLGNRQPKSLANTMIDASPPAAPPPSALAPLSRPNAVPQPSVAARGTLMMAGGPPAAPPPQAQDAPREAKPRSAPPRSAPAPHTQAHVGRPLGPQKNNGTARRPAPAVAADDTGSMLLLKRSNKGPLLLGAIGIVAAIAIFAGVRAMSHEDTPEPTTATAAQPAPPPAHTEETVIPPPPPPAEPAATAAATAETTAEAPPPVAPAPKPIQAPAPPPPPPRPVAVAAPPRAEPPRAPPPARPAAAPPKTSTKTGGGGIVRDNPF